MIVYSVLRVELVEGVPQQQACRSGQRLLRRIVNDEVEWKMHGYIYKTSVWKCYGFEYDEYDYIE